MIIAMGFLLIINICLAIPLMLWTPLENCYIKKKSIAKAISLNYSDFFKKNINKQKNNFYLRL